MLPLKPNAKRAKLAVTMIWIVMAFDIISLISGYLQYSLIKTVALGGDVTQEQVDANDLREQIIGIVYLIVFIISAVTFIQWFRRAYYNLHLRTTYLLYSEGWAAGSWFVPILCLYRPYRIMKELYEETEFLLRKKLNNFKQNISTVYVGWWWTFWIISSIIGQVLFRYSRKAETLHELTVTTLSSMAFNIFSIPLALLAIKVIKDYAKLEPLLFEIKEEEEEKIEESSDTESEIEMT